MSLRRPSCRIVAIEQVKATPDDWVWTYHRSPEHLRHNRINVLGRFIADYEAGKKAGRYVVGEPRLLDARAGSVNAIESQADHEDERGGARVVGESVGEVPVTVGARPQAEVHD